MDAIEPHDFSRFDAAALLTSMHEDRAAAAEMVRLCLDLDAPRFLAELRAGRASNDLRTLQDAAHGIKGLTGELHAGVCHRLAGELERAAQHSHPNRSAPLAAELEREFVLLCEMLQRHR